MGPGPVRSLAPVVTGGAPRASTRSAIERTGARSKTLAAARTHVPVSAKSTSRLTPNATASAWAVRERGSERPCRMFQSP